MKRILFVLLLLGCSEPTGLDSASSCGWKSAGKSYFQIPGDSRTYTLETAVCGYLGSVPRDALVARADSSLTLTVTVTLSPDQLARLR